MTAPFRLYGAEHSPFSVKVRSFLRFKGLEFEWLPRSNARQEEFARYAKLPLAPVVVDANDTALQDSTLTIEAIEAEFPEPSITPEDAALDFVSALLEDYADEWLNKAMFHYRWSYPEDRERAARRIVEMLFEDAEPPEGLDEAVQTRMIARLHHVGSSAETAPLIEASFANLLNRLEALIEGRRYLFGDRPCLADFGLAAQLGQMLSDPTPGAMMQAQAPRVVAWIERMERPSADGAFASLEAVRDPLAALLRDEVAAAHLVWMAANAQAVAEDAPGVSVVIAGHVFTQKPQRMAAKAFAKLQRTRAATDDAALAALLEETGCDAFLSEPAQDDEDVAEIGADAEEDAQEA